MICVLENKNSRGLAELSGVAGSVLIPSVSEPGMDISLRDSTLLSQAHPLNLSTQKHKYIFKHAILMQYFIYETLPARARAHS